jgi:hypothetical protein
MIETLRMRYEGPREFVVTDRQPRALRLCLVCSGGLPPGSEIRATIRNFRAFGDMDWGLDGVEIKGGHGRVVVGHGPPRTWDEMMRGAATPGGGGLIGGEHTQMHLCTALVTQALDVNAEAIVQLQATPTVYAALEAWLELRVRLQGTSGFTRIGEAVLLRTLAGEAVRLEVRNTPAPDDTGRLRGVVYATDVHANPVSDYQGRLALAAV